MNSSVDKKPGTRTLERRRRQRSIVWMHLRRNRLAMVGAAVVVLVAAVAIAGGRLAPFPPNRTDVKVKLQPPSSEHLLGTDQLGRDVFSRMVYGARISLEVGIVAVCISIVIGILVGAVAGYYGGIVDTLIMRFVDMMMCFPRFFLILTIIAVLGPNIYNVMVVIGVTSWMGTARMVRAEFLSIRARD